MNKSGRWALRLGIIVSIIISSIFVVKLSIENEISPLGFLSNLQSKITASENNGHRMSKKEVELEIRGLSYRAEKNAFVFSTVGPDFGWSVVCIKRNNNTPMDVIYRLCTTDNIFVFTSANNVVYLLQPNGLLTIILSPTQKPK